MTETISGIVAAVVTIILMTTLSKYFSLKIFAATTLVAIAFIYVGFALKNNTVNSIILEVVMALVFYFIALIGYVRNNFLIAYGIILHGVWDICHHNGFLIPTDIPSYWPVFCSVIDLIVGLYLLVVFKRRKTIQAL